MWRNVSKNIKKILPLLEEGTTIIIFDTETTGLEAHAKIIQFSGIKYKITNTGLKPVESLDRYINPEMLLPKKITEITGITDEMLAFAPIESLIADKIVDFLNSADVLLAYNAKFDVQKVEGVCERNHLVPPCKPVVDVLEMARDCVSKEESGSHKLCDIFHYFYPDKNVMFHSAIEDVQATAMVLCKCLYLYKTHTESTEKREVKVEYGRMTINPHQRSQQRYKLKLSEGDFGDIYYDKIAKRWDCKKTKQAQKLFSEVDMVNIEEQVLNKYHADNMDSLCFRTV